MALDFSIKAMCVTITQVQKCLDRQYRRRLLFCSGRKCSPSGQNWLSHHGESATFVWGLATYAWLLKQAPFLVETDSMSVKYIDTMKNSRGVHARWAELIGSYSYCVSRCPSHLPEPTQAELDMEQILLHISTSRYWRQNLQSYKSDPRGFVKWKENRSV